MNAIARTVAEGMLNSFWQAAVLAALVWLVLRLLQPGVNAATRHGIWWLALAAIVLLPFVPRRSPGVLVGAAARPEVSEAVGAARTSIR